MGLLVAERGERLAALRRHRVILFMDVASESVRALVTREQLPGKAGYVADPLFPEGERLSRIPGGAVSSQMALHSVHP
jgi:hypothetical protein